MTCEFKLIYFCSLPMKKLDHVSHCELGIFRKSILVTVFNAFTKTMFE